VIGIVTLKDKSIEIICSNQHISGSYAASPNFSIYNYCWLRDGSFTAYSMDIWGRIDSAERFFQWTHNVISKQHSRLKRILEMKKKGEILLNDDYLPARYMLDGNECNDEWPNFQLDGYGTWLWALCQHIKITENKHLIIRYKKSIDIAVDYLNNFWSYPNFDCWQENGDRIHTATLATIFGGLNAIGEYVKNEKSQETIEQIKQYVSENCLFDGRLKKCTDSDFIDASLLWTSIPFNLFELNDSRFLKTVKAIEENLVINGGVRRYPGDTYYGGGEWIILSAWLGLYYCETGQSDNANEMLKWIESTADDKKELAEQNLDNVNDERYRDKWESLWGEVASPVLWSHAMYLVLLNRIEKSIEF